MDVLFARKRGFAAGRTGQMEGRARNLPLSAPPQERVPRPEVLREKATENTGGSTTGTGTLANRAGRKENQNPLSRPARQQRDVQMSPCARKRSLAAGRTGPPERVPPLEVRREKAH